MPSYENGTLAGNLISTFDILIIQKQQMLSSTSLRGQSYVHYAHMFHCVGVCILMYIGEVRHELRLMASGWVPG